MLRCIVNRLWNKLLMCVSITPLLIGYYLSGFAPMTLQYPPEEVRCSLVIASFLGKYIDYFTVLINGTPMIMMLALDLYKYFTNEECITYSLMVSS